MCILNYIYVLFYFFLFQVFFQNPFELLDNNKIPLDSSTQNIKSSKIKKSRLDNSFKIITFLFCDKKV